MTIVPDDMTFQRPDCVASDLDGTLLAPDGRLLPTTVSGVRRLRESGIPLVICTGRMLCSARRIAEQLDLTTGRIVCYQGALVADIATGEWLLHRPLSTTLASEVIQHLRELELQVNVYVDDRLYVEAVGEWAQRYAAYADVQINVVDDLIALVRTPPTKIVVPAEPSEVDELLPRLQARWAGRLRVTRSLPQYVEICDLSATKSGALQYLCNGSGWRRERCVACGDGLNDVDMLRWAGLGVAMGQAAPAVKEAADLVIDQADLGQFFTRLAEAREA